MPKSTKPGPPMRRRCRHTDIANKGWKCKSICVVEVYRQLGDQATQGLGEFRKSIAETEGKAPISAA
jgi:hypothetical protein